MVYKSYYDGTPNYVENLTFFKEYIEIQTYS